MSFGSSLSTFEVILICIVILAFLATLSLWMYFEYRKSERQKPRANIFLMWVITSAAILAIFSLFELVGMLPPGWNSDHRWLWVLVLITTAALYWNVMRKKIPIATAKIRLKYLPLILREHFNVDLVLNDSSIRPCGFSKRTSRLGLDGTIEYYDWFMIHISDTNIEDLIVKIDSYTGTLVYHDFEPDFRMINYIRSLEASEILGEVKAFDNDSQTTA